MEGKNNKIEFLKNAIADTEKLVSDNEKKLKGLEVEAKALELLEVESREEVKILRMYIEILKANPLQDEAIMKEYYSHITALDNELEKINQIGVQMKQLYLESVNLKRANSRSESIMLGYRQQIQNIEYVKSTGGKNFLIERAAMSISETLFKESESGENKLKKFVKNIFNK